MKTKRGAEQSARARRLKSELARRYAAKTFARSAAGRFPRLVVSYTKDKLKVRITLTRKEWESKPRRVGRLTFEDYVSRIPRRFDGVEVETIGRVRTVLRSAR